MSPEMLVLVEVEPVLVFAAQISPASADTRYLYPDRGLPPSEVGATHEHASVADALREHVTDVGADGNVNGVEDALAADHAESPAALIAAICTTCAVPFASPVIV